MNVYKGSRVTGPLEHPSNLRHTTLHISLTRAFSPASICSISPDPPFNTCRRSRSNCSRTSSTCSARTTASGRPDIGSICSPSLASAPVEVPLNFCSGDKTIAGVVVVVVDVVVVLKIAVTAGTAVTAVTAGGVVVAVVEEEEDKEDVVATVLVVGVALSLKALVGREGGKECSIRLLAGATMVI